MRNTSGLKRNAGPGRPKGSRDKVPRSVKASLLQIYTTLETDHPDLFQSAIIDGLRAKPPASFPYLQLWAFYRHGKPKDTVDVPQLADIAAALARKVVHELHPGPTKSPHEVVETTSSPQVRVVVDRRPTDDTPA